MSRLEDLQQMRQVAWDSLDEAPPVSRAPLLAQLRAIVAEIDELGGGVTVERNGLIDFQEALAERQRAGSQASRRSASK